MAKALWLFYFQRYAFFGAANRRLADRWAEGRNAAVCSLYLPCSCSAILTDLVSASAFSLALKHLICGQDGSVNGQANQLGAYLSLRKPRVRGPSLANQPILHFPSDLRTAAFGEGLIQCIQMCKQSHRLSGNQTSRRNEGWVCVLA